MSSFTTPLVAEFEDDGIHYVIWQLFAYIIGALGTGISVDVPVGYRTDLASTPWWIRWLLPPNGKYGKAAVIHDYLCTTRQVMVNGVIVYITREQCDAIFFEAMTVLKVPVWQKYPMYAAVRAYANTTGLDLADYAMEAANAGHFTDVLALADKLVA
jgi:hypothetical protein